MRFMSGWKNTSDAGTDADILARARDVAAKRGHLKGRLSRAGYGDGYDAVCIRGALLLGMGRAPISWGLSDPAFKRLDAIIMRANPEVARYPNTVYWNNRPETTKDDVVAALERAHEFSLR